MLQRAIAIVFSADVGKFLDVVLDWFVNPINTVSANGIVKICVFHFLGILERIATLKEKCYLCIGGSVPFHYDAVFDNISPSRSILYENSVFKKLEPNSFGFTFVEALAETDGVLEVS